VESAVVSESHPSPASQWLRLFLAGGIERCQWARLTAQFPDPDLLASQSERALCEVGGISAEAARRIQLGAAPEEVERELERMDKAGARLITRFDPDFPVLLRQMPIAPVALYVAGELLPRDEVAVGIVGPRKPTNYAIEVTRRIAGGLARAGLTIVSGFAVGVDAAAHRCALENGARTLGVLGCGLAVDYPSGNQPIRARILGEQRGALVSEYPMTAPPLKGHFPPRNTIIAGLSLAVVVIEASERSGALVTARAALEENRHVYAVPGDIVRENARGSNALLRAGAMTLTAPEDLLEDLEGELRGLAEKHRIELLFPSKPETRKTASHSRGTSDSNEPEIESADADMDGEEGNPAAVSPARRLLRRIAREPVDFDTLMAEFVPEALSIGELSTRLVELELTGRIRQLPGKIFVAT
jgi:DNA processing protein